MSSPSSRLRKVKRSPLPELERVPFRTPKASRLPSRTGTGGDAAGTSDRDLVSSMAARLAAAESELRVARAEVTEKNAKIRELEQRLSTLTGPPLSHSTHELEKRCLTLQSQVEEMEEFLSDYGMVWVGCSDSSRSGHEENVWQPGSSLTHPSLAVDFDLLVKNIQALSLLAGEGSSAVATTPTGAKLKEVEAVPLTLYANGLVMFQGPFRPFSDPHTQQCVRDLLDGYFPSELKAQYSNGVPFRLSDKREVTFIPLGSSQIFPGHGQTLSRQRGPSRTFFTSSSSQNTTLQLPGPKLSAEQFLSRLPATVVRGGRVLDVRSEISATIHSSSPQPSVTVCEPPDLRSSSKPLSSLTTLKVRSEAGDCTYVLKMGSHETIADVWKHLLEQNSSNSSPVESRTGGLTVTEYHLVSGVTHQVYSDLSASLSDCGLTPSATLHITKTCSPHFTHNR